METFRNFRPRRSSHPSRVVKITTPEPKLGVRLVSNKSQEEVFLCYNFEKLDGESSHLISRKTKTVSDVEKVLRDVSGVYREEVLSEVKCYLFPTISRL